MKKTPGSDATAGSAGLRPAYGTPVDSNHEESRRDNGYPRKPLGWYSRGHLPHLDTSGVFQAVTFRLADSVPQEVVQGWKIELGLHDISDAGSHEATELRRRIAKYEDAGHGACHLRDPRIAVLVRNAIRHFEGERYELKAWCVMPNHVHVLLRTGDVAGSAGFRSENDAYCDREPAGGRRSRDASVAYHRLPDILRSWKTYTAREAHRILGVAPGTASFWMRESFDRFIRDENHFWATVRYIHENPVSAGLCAKAEDWRWSSASNAERPERE